MEDTNVESHQFPHHQTKYHVVFYADQGVVKAVPGCVVAGPKDIVVFESLDIDVQFFIPDIDQIFELREVHASTFSLQEGIPMGFVVKEDAQRGLYAYAVFSHTHRHFAVGHSDPTIIIRSR
jgi:hypothetical protein